MCSLRTETQTAEEWGEAGPGGCSDGACCRAEVNSNVLEEGEEKAASGGASSDPERQGRQCRGRREEGAMDRHCHRRNGE